MSEHIEKLVRGEIDQSELTRDDNDELLAGKGTRPNRAQSQMLSLRVPVESMRSIERLAAQRDVPVSALVRGWILSSLADSEQDSLPRAIDRVAADVDRLRSIASR